MLFDAFRFCFDVYFFLLPRAIGLPPLFSVNKSHPRLRADLFGHYRLRSSRHSDAKSAPLCMGNRRSKEDEVRRKFLRRPGRPSGTSEPGVSTSFEDNDP